MILALRQALSGCRRVDFGWESRDQRGPSKTDCHVTQQPQQPQITPYDLTPALSALHTNPYLNKDKLIAYMIELEDPLGLTRMWRGRLMEQQTISLIYRPLTNVVRLLEL